MEISFIEDSITCISKIDNKHEFFPDENKIKNCYFCGEEMIYHIKNENKNKRNEENNLEGKIFEGN